MNAHDGTEEEKIAAAKELHPRIKKRSHDDDDINVSQFLHKIGCEGGGSKGVLGQVLCFV